MNWLNGCLNCCRAGEEMNFGGGEEHGETRERSFESSLGRSQGKWIKKDSGGRKKF